MMNGHRALLGALAGLALALAPACRHTAEGAKEDARENSEKAQTATQKAADETKEAAQKVGEQAKEAAGKVGEGAQEAGAKVKEGAREVVSQLDASKQLVDVKAALMADSGIDASNIRVDTDADSKTVTLRGSVPTSSQKLAADRIARDKAQGYTVVNHLMVTAKSSGPPSD